MIRADKDAVRAALELHHDIVFDVVHGAWKEWQALGLSGRLLFPGRSRACLVHDFMVQRAINAWTDDASVRVIQHDETAKFVVGNAVLLRFKKADDRGLGANIPTQAALDFAEQQHELPGIPNVHKVEIVYVLNHLQTQVDRVVVVARDGNVRLWDYIIERKGGTDVIPMPILPAEPDQERRVKIVVRKPASTDDKTSEAGE